MTKISAVKPRYIFLVNEIGNVGGGQLYVASKAQWLESEGWDVDIYYFDRSEIMIPYMKKHEGNYIRNFEFRFFSLSDKELEETTRHIIGDSTSEDRVVIESFSQIMAVWGEHIASKIGAKHLFYNLGEKGGYDKREEAFLRFKLNQHLLYGINTKSIPSILPGADGDSTALSAVGCAPSNAADIDDPRMKLIPSDGFNVLCVSRLEKHYVTPMAREVIEFAADCPEPVNFIIVGDTPNVKERNAFKELLDNKPNLRPIYWGYAFPVTRKLYQRADVFVGCAASSRRACNENTPTITVDVTDFQGIGILGETTQNRLYRNTDEPPVKISKLLRQIYEQREERRKARELMTPIEESFDFSSHKEIIDAPYEKIYFPTRSIKNSPLLTFVYKTIKTIGGNTLLYNLKRIKHKLQKRKYS